MESYRGKLPGELEWGVGDLNRQLEYEWGSNGAKQGDELVGQGGGHTRVRVQWGASRVH